MSDAFAGSDYEPRYDDKRLLSQIDRVRDALMDGTFRTLSEIRAITGDGEASISAQIRNLRKSQHGAYVIERRARGDRCHGLFEYRLVGQVQAGKLF